MVAGIVGCILPVLPGPPVSYAGLVLLQFTSRHPFSTRFLLMFAALTILITVLDYIIPIYGTKKLQGTKYGILGSALGLLIGLIFFPPFGIIICPMLGAFLGELVTGKKADRAIKSALGSLLGFLTGTAIKLVVSIVMAYYFILNVL